MSQEECSEQPAGERRSKNQVGLWDAEGVAMIYIKSGGQKSQSEQPVGEAGREYEKRQRRRSHVDSEAR